MRYRALYREEYKCSEQTRYLTFFSHNNTGCYAFSLANEESKRFVLRFVDEIQFLVGEKFR